MADTSRQSLWIPKIAVVFLVVSLVASALVVQESRAQTLPPAPVYEITGRVLDAENRALSEATVVVATSGAAPKANTTTDADGKYKFSQLEEGTYEVAASHKCCLRASATVTVGGLQLSTEAPDLVLSRKEAPASGQSVLLKGVAFDKKTNAKLVGVTIEIDNYYGDQTQPASSCPPDADCAAKMVDGGSYQHFSIVTAADGSYEVETNPGTISVWAYRSGYDTARTSRTISSPTTLDVPMRPVDTANVRLFGVLKSSSGGPIAGAYVHVSPDYSAETRCDGDVCMAVPVDQREGEWHYESSQNAYNSTTTAADGSWELRTTPGLRMVEAWAEEHLNTRLRVDARAGDDRQVDLVLEKIPADSVRVFGTVKDAKSGKAIPYAQISLENQKWGHWNSTQAGPDGRFDIWTKPGYTIVTASASRHDYACVAMADAGAPVSEARTMVIPSPCQPMPEREADYYPRVTSFSAGPNSEREVAFKLKPRPERSSLFEGYVLNGTTGKAVAGAQVTFYNEATSDWGSATTDDNGSFRIKVHAGYYTIRAWAEGFFDAVLNAEIEAKETQRLDLQMEAGEKRYGYYGPLAYAHMDYAVAGAPEGPSPSQRMGASDSASGTPVPTPTEGEHIYAGEKGGLGPYRAQSAGGSAPSPMLFLVALGVGLAFGLARRARPAR